MLLIMNQFGSGCNILHRWFLIGSICGVSVKLILIMLKDSGSVKLHKVIYSELSSSRCWETIIFN